MAQWWKIKILATVRGIKCKGAHQADYANEWSKLVMKVIVCVTGTPTLCRFFTLDAGVPS
jgi:hypothetical protein